MRQLDGRIRGAIDVGNFNQVDLLFSEYKELHNMDSIFNLVCYAASKNQQLIFAKFLDKFIAFPADVGEKEILLDAGGLLDILIDDAVHSEIRFIFLEKCSSMHSPAIILGMLEAAHMSQLLSKIIQCAESKTLHYFLNRSPLKNLIMDQVLAQKNGQDIGYDYVKLIHDVIISALKFEQLWAIQLVLNVGISLDIQNKDENTVLHQIATLPNPKKEWIKPLFAFFPNLNIKNNLQELPLHTAAYHVNVDVVKLLLDYGSDIDVPNYQGNTPLMMALLYECTFDDTSKCRFEHLEAILTIVSILLERCSSLSLQNMNNSTALDLGILTGQKPIIDLLKSHTPQGSCCSGATRPTNFLKESLMYGFSAFHTLYQRYWLVGDAAPLTIEAEENQPLGFLDANLNSTLLLYCVLFPRKNKQIRIQVDSLNSSLDCLTHQVYGALDKYQLYEP